MTDKKQEDEKSLRNNVTYRQIITSVPDTKEGNDATIRLDKITKDNPYLAAALTFELATRKALDINFSFTSEDITQIAQDTQIKAITKEFQETDKDLSDTLDKKIEKFGLSQLSEQTYQKHFEEQKIKHFTPQSSIDLNNPWVVDAAFEFGEAFNTFDDKILNKALQNSTLTIAACMAKKERPDLTYEELIKDQNIIEFGRNLEKNGHKNKANTIKEETEKGYFKKFLDQHKAPQTETQKKISMANIMNVSDYLTPSN